MPPTTPSASPAVAIRAELRNAHGRFDPCEGGAMTTWHRVAPDLARRGLTVICPDLRGYGRSSKPAPDAQNERYCDRTMARDVVALVRDLGHEAHRAPDDGATRFQAGCNSPPRWWRHNPPTRGTPP